jgi:hypothetical protein
LVLAPAIAIDHLAYDCASLAIAEAEGVPKSGSLIKREIEPSVKWHR